MTEESGWYDQDAPVSWWRFAFEEVIAIGVLAAFCGVILAFAAAMQHGTIQ